MPGPHGGQRAQTVRVYLRHHKDPEGKFTPQTKTCESDPEKGRVGCGATITFYITYPNQKRIPFDGEAKVVLNSEAALDDGAIVGSVYTDNVHFVTCPHARGNDQRRRDAQTRAPGQKGATA